MSPRQDTYMSLCLEQASKSPLHYRHGCIIVRGGKFIGRGFNHHRPGFNGGALKDGRTKIAGDVLQQKMKQKHKSHAGEELPGSNGGGSDANLALSMHSEMMAIRSAQSLSSHHSGTSARSTAWYETPRFKLPGHDTRGHRLRKEKIRQHRVARLVLNRVHVDSTKSYHSVPNEVMQNTTKNQKRKQNENKTLMAHPRPSEIAQRQRQYQHHETKAPRSKRPKKLKDNISTDSPRPKYEPMLIAVAHSTPKAGRVMQRRMDNCLNGADLYVVRQAWKHRAMKKKTGFTPKKDEEVSSLCTHSAALPVAEAPPTMPLSLHDELTCKVPRPLKGDDEEKSGCEPPLPATSSRPCYRCISYMQQAGIRRVFWSNNAGDWEGGKVRDLVDALGLDQGNVGDSDHACASMFVTKQEILMLRRQMGGP